ncbi:MAG: NAD(+) diphosphatase [Geobacteraceae bacterium]|nr:NAD(+) diphosphatase [Geobacteraceae bacterium]
MTTGIEPACQEVAYPEAVNLPFNFSSVKAEFEFRAPASELQTAECYWVIIQGTATILEETHTGLKLPHGSLPDWLVAKHPSICIGSWRGKPLRVVSADSNLTPPPPFVCKDFNASDESMDIQTLTLAGMAKQILHWDRQSRHCSRCGAFTETIPGTWGRHCNVCNVEHYPHIHPCAIVLVKRGDELLLTRKAEWVAGRYSLVAGFLDFGESLEECAIREIREETGIEVCNVRYVGSQNWPFPAQLMAGFVADYEAGDICVDLNELEDARWFRSDELPLLPGKRSIARWIIDNFK